MHAPAGHVFGPADQPIPFRCALVVSGILRLYVESPDARQITFRYAGAGYFLGAARAAIGDNSLPPFGVQAVTATDVLFLDIERLIATARKEAPVAWALLEQAARYQNDLVRILSGTAFGSIAQRTAMHLLSLAVSGPDGAFLAPVTQQALADAVGTTRETVARALGDLRDSGLVETVRGGILLRDPERLATL